MSTIFFSWQSDRPTSICRNFIERSIQSAIDRLHADAEIEEALREELEVDKDTKNVPGTPAVFDTIMTKIAAASVFVPDLTFVGQRPDGRSTSNPNVLIEYGYALAKPGSARIIAVMNDAFGEPSRANMPFNIAHTRFPITYTLTENASDEEKKSARKVLNDKFESALRTIIQSPAYKLQAQSTRPSALEIAALHQKDLDYETALSALNYGDGPSKVRQNVESLFGLIEAQLHEVEAKHNFGIGCGSEFQPQGRGAGGICVLRNSTLGAVVRWHQPQPGSLRDAKLNVQEFRGRLFVPGEFQGGVYLNQPSLVGESFYEPTLSSEHELGWVKAGRNRQEPAFLSNAMLADICVSQLLNSLRQDHQKR